MKYVGFNTFISACLKGISQVMLIDNALSGATILIAIFIADYKLGIVALISVIIGTLTGYFVGKDRSLVDEGLFGYNSVLIGLASYLFFIGDIGWIMAFVGAFFVAIFTGIIMHMFEDRNIPVLTLPYIILTWLLLLASYQFKIFKLNPDLVPQDLSHWKLNVEGHISFIDGLINGFGQIFFIDNIWSGILIFLGVLWAGWKFNFYSIIGSAIGFFIAYVLGGEHTPINLGLYGYNAVLTILAVSVVFDSETPLSKCIGIIASIITVPITASIHTLLLPYGLPILTMPFVVTTWIFLVARGVLRKL